MLTDERPPAPAWPEEPVVPLYPGAEIYCSPAPNGSYRIDRQRRTCTCPDHQYRQRECKHLRAADAMAARLAWEREMTPLLFDRAQAQGEAALEWWAEQSEERGKAVFA